VAASTAIVLVPAQAAGGAVDGIISLQYLKDPTDPLWNDDPAMLRYREIMGTYSPSQNLDDSFVAFGWSQCELIRQVLNNIEPTRESLMEVVGNLQAYDIEIDIFLPGIEVGTAPGQGFLIRSMQVVEFNGTYFELKGDPITPD
jgi:branched-chain amino acid transport system substrate-binding protein